MQAGLQRIRDQGGDPQDVSFIFDFNASPSWVTVMRKRSPCLLASRPHGYYITSRGRRMTLPEMCRLQGFVPFSCKSVSRVGLGAMIGHATNLEVVHGVLGRSVACPPLTLSAVSLVPMPTL